MRQVKTTSSRNKPALFWLPLATWFWLIPLCAHGSPLLDSRVGGLSLVGPSTAHPASTFYNPATLELRPGHHVFFDGTVRLGHGAFQRRAVDSLTGQPAASGGMLASQTLMETFPQFFLGFSSDLGSDSVVVSIYACTPVARHISLRNGDGLPSSTAGLRPRSEEDRADLLAELFDPTIQSQARYQATDLTLFHLFITAATSYEVVDELVIGVSVSYVFGVMDLAFVRDAALEGGSSMDTDKGEYVALNDCGAGKPCHYENDDAAEAVSISGKSHSVAFAAGLLVRLHDDVDVGAGYVSKVYGGGGDMVEATGDAWVLRSRAAHANNKGAPRYRDQVGRGTVTYAMPQMVHAGVTWRTTPRIALNLQFRWLHLSTHEHLTIQLTGTEFREEPQMPDRLVHYRGFQDVFAAQIGAGFRLSDRLAIQAGVMLESSAVPASAVTVNNIDAFKIDTLLALHWRISDAFSLRAGYGIVLMPEVDADRSDLSPSLMTRCVDNRYNVDLQDCRDSAMGKGLPSAAGTYSWVSHRLGVGVSYDVW